MMRVRVFDGSQADDTCDYCRKLNGEVVSVEITGKRWSDKQSVQFHMKCLQLALAKLKIPAEGLAK